MVVDRSYKQDSEAALKVTIPGGNLQELDRKTGQSSAGQSLGKYRTQRAKLSPGNGRLFRVVE